MRKEFLVLGVLLVVIASLIPAMLLSSTSKNEGMIKVNLTVSYGQETSELLTVKNGTTVFDVLNKSHIIEYKEYTGLGKLIISIDGIEQNSNHAWFYWVDDFFAEVSVDNYILTKNANVNFKLEDMNKMFP